MSIHAVKNALAMAVALLALSTSADWERPRTTRRYLHPPMVDCMYTIWNDGKVMRGENRHQHDWKIDYSDLMADVLWVFHGEDDRPFDFRESVNRLPENGIPFHGLTWRVGDLVTDMDAFCETGPRSPACFIRLTVKNEGANAVREPYVVFMRRMQENTAVNGAPDVDAASPEVYESGGGKVRIPAGGMIAATWNRRAGGSYLLTVTLPGDGVLTVTSNGSEIATLAGPATGAVLALESASAVFPLEFSYVGDDSYAEIVGMRPNIGSLIVVQ